MPERVAAPARIMRRPFPSMIVALPWGDSRIDQSARRPVMTASTTTAQQSGFDTTFVFYPQSDPKTDRVRQAVTKKEKTRTIDTVLASSSIPDQASLLVGSEVTCHELCGIPGTSYRYSMSYEHLSTDHRKGMGIY